MSDKDLTPADLEKANDVLEQHIPTKPKFSVLGTRVQKLSFNAKLYARRMREENINPADYFSDYEPEAEAEGGKEEVTVLFRDKVMARIHNLGVTIQEHISKIRENFYPRTQITLAFMSYYYDSTKRWLSVKIAELHLKSEPYVQGTRVFFQRRYTSAVKWLSGHRTTTFLVGFVLSIAFGTMTTLASIMIFTWMGFSSLMVMTVSQTVGAISTFLFGYLLNEYFESKYRQYHIWA